MLLFDKTLIYLLKTQIQEILKLILFVLALILP